MESLEQGSSAGGFHWREILLLPLSPMERLEDLEDIVDLSYSFVILFVSALAAAIVRSLTLAEETGGADRLLAAGFWFGYIIASAAVFSLVSSRLLPSTHRSNRNRFKKTFTLVGYCSPWIAASAVVQSMTQSFMTDELSIGFALGIDLLALALGILVLVIVVSAVAVANSTSRGRAFAGAIVGVLAIGGMALLAVLAGLDSFI